ncbi:MAG: phage protein NinX family protein [Thalassospira sp.]|uniref:phage protein NinX family protein n=1 Tax=Thalassospira sp. TaxID=1912094 RepID=UPI003A857D3B
MKMKVSDLDGRALNWAVAFTLYGEPSAVYPNSFAFDESSNVKAVLVARLGVVSIDRDEFNPSGNWAHGGPIFEKTGIFPTYCHDWDAFHGPQTDPMPYEAEGERCVMYGEKPLIAGCRAVVYNAVGPTIEIPDELCEVVS